MKKIKKKVCSRDEIYLKLYGWLTGGPVQKYFLYFFRFSFNIFNLSQHKNTSMYDAGFGFSEVTSHLTLGFQSYDQNFIG